MGEIVVFGGTSERRKIPCIPITGEQEEMEGGDIYYKDSIEEAAALIQGRYHIKNKREIYIIDFFLNQLNIPWEQVRLISSHGENGNLLQEIRGNAKVCTLLGEEDDIKNICKRLLQFGMERVKITIGEGLSYPTEQITMGYPKDFAERNIDTFSVALFENKDYQNEVQSGILDEEFFRGQVPMAKEEVRAIALRKLRLQKDSVVYDIGAGTGSISIEAAGLCMEGKVYAIERKDEAIELIRKNQHQFQVCNIEIVKGEAPEVLGDLDPPTHVFIGEGNGKIQEIVKEIRKKNPQIRVVISATDMETIVEAQKLKEEYPDMEMVQIQISKAQKLGEYHLMKGQNPVCLFSFGGMRNGW